jgi:hypothetical protein
MHCILCIILYALYSMHCEEMKVEVEEAEVVVKENPQQF